MSTRKCNFLFSFQTNATLCSVVLEITLHVIDYFGYRHVGLLANNKRGSIIPTPELGIITNTYLELCDSAWNWHFRVLKTFKNSPSVNSRIIATFWSEDCNLTQAIWIVAFQNIVASVSFFTAKTSWCPFESRYFFDLKGQFKDIW